MKNEEKRFEAEDGKTDLEKDGSAISGGYTEANTKVPLYPEFDLEIKDAEKIVLVGEHGKKKEILPSSGYHAI